MLTCDDGVRGRNEIFKEERRGEKTREEEKRRGGEEERRRREEQGFRSAHPIFLR